jgi:hypothetical protein
LDRIYAFKLSWGIDHNVDAMHSNLIIPQSSIQTIPTFSPAAIESGPTDLNLSSSRMRIILPTSVSAPNQFRLSIKFIAYTKKKNAWSRRNHVLIRYLDDLINQLA